jgi:hypothetical protein
MYHFRAGGKAFLAAAAAESADESARLHLKAITRISSALFLLPLNLGLFSWQYSCSVHYQASSAALKNRQRKIWPASVRLQRDDEMPVLAPR